MSLAIKILEYRGKIECDEGHTSFHHEHISVFLFFDEWSESK